jgi:hypothetical protein
MRHAIFRDGRSISQRRREIWKMTVVQCEMFGVGACWDGLLQVLRSLDFEMAERGLCN